MPVVKTIQTLSELEALYCVPKPASIRKVTDHITPEYGAWIAASPFCALATVGPHKADASPRGDEGQVAFTLDPKTLAIPDRQGNDRIDTLRNIVEDGRVAAMFMIPGSGTVIRVNGRAVVRADARLLERYTVHGKAPRSVILIHVAEVYFQCARAVLRAGLWDESKRPDVSKLPSVGQILASLTDGEVGGETYDADWAERAAKTMW